MITDIRPGTESRFARRAATYPRLGHDRLVAIAMNLVPTVAERGFEANRSQRCWDLLACSPDFEAWAIGWPAGGAIELHDHGDSVGAVVVVSGELVETSITEEAGHLATRSTPLKAGSTLRLKRKCIHDVVNLGSELAVSVHVYAPRLKSMTYYELVEGSLDPVRTVRY
jgi:Cysteine dioxygenase type I